MDVHRLSRQCFAAAVPASGQKVYFGQQTESQPLKEAPIRKKEDTPVWRRVLLGISLLLAGAGIGTTAQRITQPATATQTQTTEERVFENTTFTNQYGDTVNLSVRKLADGTNVERQITHRKDGTIGFRYIQFNQDGSRLETRGNINESKRTTYEVWRHETDGTSRVIEVSPESGGDYLAIGGN